MHTHKHICMQPQTHTHRPWINSAYWSALLTGEVLFWNFGLFWRIESHPTPWLLLYLPQKSKQHSGCKGHVIDVLENHHSFDDDDAHIRVVGWCLPGLRRFPPLSSRCSSLSHVLVKGRTFLEAFHFSLEADNCIQRMQCCHSFCEKKKKKNTNYRSNTEEPSNLTMVKFEIAEAGDAT